MKKEEKTIQHLRTLCFGENKFPEEVLQWISYKNLWNLWVPQAYFGLEASFSDGLHKLKNLAKIDGSLGWTVTLCSGANYFIGNLKPKVAGSIFKNNTPPILGGSGGAFGTAERQKDGSYKLSGTWRYATGAPYLTHFTLNAKVVNQGKQLKSNDGADKILSFISPKNKIKIIDDWNTMGLKATATCSFVVDEQCISSEYGFRYDKFYLNQSIYKIPFTVFADLTLWVNYIGMAEHYREEAEVTLPKKQLKELDEIIRLSDQNIFDYAEKIEELLTKKSVINQGLSQEIHQEAIASLPQLSQAILNLHPFLGMKASRKDSQLNKIFRDYFTATQHHNFVNR